MVYVFPAISNESYECYILSANVGDVMWCFIHSSWSSAIHSYAHSFFYGFHIVVVVCYNIIFASIMYLYVYDFLWLPMTSYDFIRCRIMCPYVFIIYYDVQMISYEFTLWEGFFGFVLMVIWLPMVSEAAYDCLWFICLQMM